MLHVVCKMHAVTHLCLNQMLSVLCCSLGDVTPIDTQNMLTPKHDNIEVALTQSHNMCWRLYIVFRLCISCHIHLYSIITCEHSIAIIYWISGHLCEETQKCLEIAITNESTNNEGYGNMEIRLGEVELETY